MKARVRKKFNIFEGIDDYYLGFYENIPHPCPRGIVGKVLNRSDSKIHIPIVVDDEEMEKNGCGSCVYDGDHENVLNSAIFMTSEFFEKFWNDKILACVLWHEIGHFHTFRYFDLVHDETGSAMTIRGEYINRGEILPEEKAADLFALYYTSQNKMLSHFDLSIEEHLDIKGNIIPGYEMTVKELRLRKDYIESIGCSKEEILKEICYVCGVNKA